MRRLRNFEFLKNSHEHSTAAARFSLVSLQLVMNELDAEGTAAILTKALQVCAMFCTHCTLRLVFQRNRALPSLHTVLEADVARLWPASSASAPLPPPVWSAFFGHPRLFE